MARKRNSALSAGLPLHSEPQIAELGEVGGLGGHAHERIGAGLARGKRRSGGGLGALHVEACEVCEHVERQVAGDELVSLALGGQDPGGLDPPRKPRCGEVHARDDLTGPRDRANGARDFLEKVRGADEHLLSSQDLRARREQRVACWLLELRFEDVPAIWAVLVVARCPGRRDCLGDGPDGRLHALGGSAHQEQPAISEVVCVVGVCIDGPTVHFDRGQRLGARTADSVFRPGFSARRAERGDGMELEIQVALGRLRPYLNRVAAVLGRCGRCRTLAGARVIGAPRGKRKGHGQDRESRFPHVTSPTGSHHCQKSAGAQSPSSMITLRAGGFGSSVAATKYTSVWTPHGTFAQPFAKSAVKQPLAVLAPDL